MSLTGDAITPDLRMTDVITIDIKMTDDMMTYIKTNNVLIDFHDDD